MLGLMHVRLPTTRPWIGVTVIGMTLLSLSPGSAHAQLVPETAPHITPAQLDALRTSLENAARAELTAKDLPSVALAIVTRDGIVLEFFLGFEDEARTRPVTEVTVFRMGSISKMLTGVTAMIAQEEGLLELDEPSSRTCLSFGKFQVASGSPSASSSRTAPDLFGNRRSGTTPTLLNRHCGPPWQAWLRLNWSMNPVHA